jgi:hypothetical protein
VNGLCKPTLLNTLLLPVVVAVLAVMIMEETAEAVAVQVVIELQQVLLLVRLLLTP